MTMWLWIARSVAATILGLVIFAAFLSYLLVSHFSGKLLDTRIYTATLLANDTYNRLYDEVLVDSRISRFLGRVPTEAQLVTQKEIAEIARSIAPPEYLQAEVEENLDRGIKYMNGETEELELAIDLREPLAEAQITLFEYIDRRIDELETLEVNPDQELPAQVAQVERLANEVIWDIATGRTPEEIPAISLIPEPLRAPVFDTVLPNVVNNSTIDQRVRQGLRDEAPKLRQEFIAGDTRQFLKEAARAGLTPLVERELAALQRYTDEQGRLDLIATAARNNSNVTEASLRRDVGNFRDQVQKVISLGRDTALMVAIIATVLMALVHAPSLINALRWPGLTLLLTGMVLLVVGKVLAGTLPQRVNSLVDMQLDSASNLPPSVVALAGDLAHSFIDQLFTGLGNPAIAILLVGALLFGASFLLHWLKPAAPWIR